jgi:FkbM family methyltransferase
MNVHSGEEAARERPWRRALRGALKLLPDGLVVRVPLGPMRGMRWMPESMPHGAWLGQLERTQLEAFVTRIQPGATVWDVGANVGLYALPSARACGARGAVFAFEPVARNLGYLRRHISLNHLRNVHVIDVAVSDRAGEVRMAPGASASEAAISEQGPWVVRALTLDGWREQTATPAPSLIKIDVEGNEHRVLGGALATLRSARPIVFVSIHGHEQAAACRSILTNEHYRLQSLQAGVAVENASEWLAVPEAG